MHCHRNVASNPCVTVNTARCDPMRLSTPRSAIIRTLSATIGPSVRNHRRMLHCTKTDPALGAVQIATGKFVARSLSFSYERGQHSSIERARDSRGFGDLAGPSRQGGGFECRGAGRSISINCRYIITAANARLSRLRCQSL